MFFIHWLIFTESLIVFFFLFFFSFWATSTVFLPRSVCLLMYLHARAHVRLCIYTHAHMCAYVFTHTHTRVLMSFITSAFFP